MLTVTAYQTSLKSTLRMYLSTLVNFVLYEIVNRLM
jgi:hypothetical protein